MAFVVLTFTTILRFALKSDIFIMNQKIVGAK
jgi:hypothetical protein